jgi:hypothetical protein
MEYDHQGAAQRGIVQPLEQDDGDNPEDFRVAIPVLVFVAAAAVCAAVLVL